MRVQVTSLARRIPAEVFPPGEYLRDELEARGLSLAEFAAAIGREPESLSRLILGKAQLTADIALRLEDALGLDARYWLNLESTYRLAKSRERRIAQRKSVQSAK